MSLVQSGGGALDGVAVDQEAILKTLNLNPRDPKVQALVLVCQQYGLDPVLKHAVLISGNLYVTRDGLLHVAHQSGRLDGIVVQEEGETGDEWWARVAVYVKGQTHPYTYRGRYPKSGHQKKYGPEMAVKCAEVMALRRAFGITGIATVEEQWDKTDALAVEAKETTPDPGRVPTADDVPSFIDPPGIDGKPKVKAKGAGGKRTGSQISMYTRIKAAWPDAKQPELDARRHALIRHASEGRTESSLDADDDLCRAVEMLVDEITEPGGRFTMTADGDGYEIGAGPKPVSTAGEPPASDDHHVGISESEEPDGVNTVITSEGGSPAPPESFNAQLSAAVDDDVVEAEIVDEALDELRSAIALVPGLGEARVLKRARRIALDNGWDQPESFEGITGPTLDRVYAEVLAKVGS